MSANSITELNLNSITISNSNFSNSKGFTAQSNTLETNNAGVLLVNGVPISSGGGGAVDDITEGSGISVDEVSTGVFEITNTGVLSIADGTNITITEDTPGNFTINSTGGGGGNVNAVTGGTGINVTETPSGSGTFEIENVGVTSLIQGDGISLDFTTGDITVTSTVNPDDYYTVIDADDTFQTKTAMGDYSTTAEADALYQTLTDMASYSTTTEANALYQSQVAMANYSTTAQANALYNRLFVRTTYNLQANTPLLPVGTAYKLFESGQFLSPGEGIFLFTTFIEIESYDADGNLGNYIGSGQIDLVIAPTSNPSNTTLFASQTFAIGGPPKQVLAVSLSGICSIANSQFFYVGVVVDSLASGGTQYLIKQTQGNTVPGITFLNTSI
jgi:hypothetical protein